MKRFSNTSKKAVVVLCVLSFGFAAPSLRVAYAWSIPGVTEPFDPPNYYSPTSISWPDSAPSPFALKYSSYQEHPVRDKVRCVARKAVGQTWDRGDTCQTSIQRTETAEYGGHPRSASFRTEKPGKN